MSSLFHPILVFGEIISRRDMTSKAVIIIRRLNFIINQSFPPIIFISGHLFVNHAQFFFQVESIKPVHLVCKTGNFEIIQTIFVSTFYQIYRADDLVPSSIDWPRLDFFFNRESCSNTYQCTARGLWRLLSVTYFNLQ